MGRAIVAESDGALVGYIILTPLWKPQDGTRAVDLTHLYVVPAARGQGLGRALVEAGREAARKGGAIRLTIGTTPENHAAQSLYRHLGLAQQAAPGPRFAQDL